MTRLLLAHLSLEIRFVDEWRLWYLKFSRSNTSHWGDFTWCLAKFIVLLVRIITHIFTDCLALDQSTHRPYFSFQNSYHTFAHGYVIFHEKIKYCFVMFRLSFCIQNSLLTLWLRVHNLGLLTPSLVFDVAKKLFNSQSPLALSAKRILLSPQRQFLLRRPVFDLTWEESTFFKLFAVMSSILSFNFLIRNFVAFVSLDSFWVELLA